MKNYTIPILLAVIAAILLFKGDSPASLGGFANFDTFDSGVTSTNVTVAVTSTQVLASVSKVAWVINDSANNLKCALDDIGTTAASSTLSTGNYYPLGANVTTTSMFSSVLTLGECYPGAVNCLGFKGTLNCSSSVATVVRVIKK